MRTCWYGSADTLRGVNLTASAPLAPNVRNLRAVGRRDWSESSASVNLGCQIWTCSGPPNAGAGSKEGCFDLSTCSFGCRGRRTMAAVIGGSPALADRPPGASPRPEPQIGAYNDVAGNLVYLLTPVHYAIRVRPLSHTRRWSSIAGFGNMDYELTRAGPLSRHTPTVEDAVAYGSRTQAATWSSSGFTWTCGRPSERAGRGRVQHCSGSRLLTLQGATTLHATTLA